MDLVQGQTVLLSPVTDDQRSPADFDVDKELGSAKVIPNTSNGESNLELLNLSFILKLVPPYMMLNQTFAMYNHLTSCLAVRHRDCSERSVQGIAYRK